VTQKITHATAAPELAVPDAPVDAAALGWLDEVA